MNIFLLFYINYTIIIQYAHYNQTLISHTYYYHISGVKITASAGVSVRSCVTPITLYNGLLCRRVHSFDRGVRMCVFDDLRDGLGLLSVRLRLRLMVSFRRKSKPTIRCL